MAAAYLKKIDAGFCASLLQEEKSSVGLNIYYLWNMTQPAL